MKKAKEIYCPECQRRVASYGGKTSLYISALCRKCNVMVVYDPETDSTTVKRKPMRITSSGKRFF